MASRTAVVFATWAAIAMAGGCDCSGVQLAGDAGDTPIPPADTVGSRCTASEECDDGEACNGVEWCDPGSGRCAGGGVQPDFTQCTTSDGRYASCVDGRCDLDYEEMFVPAGPFVMGADLHEGTGCAARIPRPEHVVTLSAYFIDRYELTNRRYRRCEARGECPPQAYEASVGRRGATAPYYSDPAFADYPVVNMSLAKAMAYCAYEGKRLPTEAEWEKAARGGCELIPPSSCNEEDERMWPWDWPPLDDEPADCRYTNSGWIWSDEGCEHDTMRVGSHPLGRSPYGVDDMVGNIWEMTGDCIEDYAACADGCTDPVGFCDWSLPPDSLGIVLRGGSFHELCTVFARGDGAASEWGSQGFRCLRPGGEHGGSTGGAKRAEDGRRPNVEGGDHEWTNLDLARRGHVGMPRARGGVRAAVFTESVNSACPASPSRRACRRTRRRRDARFPSPAVPSTRRPRTSTRSPGSSATSTSC